MMQIARDHPGCGRLIHIEAKIIDGRQILVHFELKRGHRNA